MAALVDDSAVAYLVVVVATVAVVTTSGLIASRFFIRHAALRHGILLIALVCSLASPLIAWGFLAANTSVVEIPLFASEVTFSETMAAPRRSGSSSFRRDSELLNSLDDVQRAMGGARPASSGIGMRVACLWGWAIGALCLLLQFAWAALCLRKLRRLCYVPTDVALHQTLHEASRRVGLKYLPGVLVSRELRVPVVIGPLHPAVVFPEATLAGISRAAQSDVLVHELAHVVRRDHLVLLLQAAARVLFWPILTVHLLNRSLGIAREELCDNYVLLDSDPVTYGETLLRLGELALGMPCRPSSLGALHAHSALEGRVVRLLDPRRDTMTGLKRSARCALLVVFSCGTVLLCGMTLVGAQSGKTEGEETGKAKVETSRPDEKQDSPAEEVQTQSDSPEHGTDAGAIYRPLGRFRYGQSLVGGTGTKKWTSGATLATLPPDERGLSRFVFSFALDSNGPDLRDLRLVALDEHGNALTSVVTQSAAASATGTRNRVVTFVVAFKHSHDKVKELAIEERLPAGEQHSIRLETDSDGAKPTLQVVEGPFISGDDCSLEQPTDEEILEVVGKASGGRFGGSKGRARVTKEKIADYVDPPRFVPTIGQAQLHNIHYKCTVYFDQKGKPSVQSAGEKSRHRTVYINHAHFHLTGNQQRN